jgi:hypothetical protein
VSSEVSGRLDDEKLETLRSWGAGLAANGRDELRAAGKAILILVEEIERLQVDVWHTREESSESHAGPQEMPKTSSPEAIAEEFLASGRSSAELESTLAGRVRRMLGARSLKDR